VDNFVRPASLSSGQIYYPVYINSGVYAWVKNSTLTLQQLQIIDLDLARATNNPLLRVSQGGVLTLDVMLTINIFIYDLFLESLGY